MRNVICLVFLLIFLYAYWRLMSWGSEKIGIILLLAMIGLNFFIAYLLDSRNLRYRGREPG